jgi:serine/threonine-protein kinase
VIGTGDPPLPGARTPDALALATGAVFARRYRLVRRMNAGSMADLYEAEHLHTRRRVALKVLHPEVMADPAALERFRREATACADIDSEHIVAVLDSDVDPTTQRPFLVMEYLHGKDLAQYIADTWGASAPIPTSQALLLLRQVASALDKVHAAGIVHRDLKPANLFLVTPDDGPPRIKIVDFGVAKLLRERSGSEGERIGTPLYMAPEQLVQGASLSPATDVWALALIAYELFVGAPYWEGNTAASLFERIPDRRQHPLPSTLAAARGVKLTPSFDRWLLRCIDPDPAQRPASAGAAIAELFRLFDPQATQPPSRHSGTVPSPLVADLEETQRQGKAPRDQYARTEPNIPVAVARHAKPIPRPRKNPGASPPTARSLAPTAPTMPTATTVEPVLTSLPLAGLPDLEERPTIPASRMPRQRVRPVSPPSVNSQRVRDPSEALTIKMPTVGARHDARQTMDPLPIVHRASPEEGTGAPRQTMDPLPLVTAAAHPRPTMEALPLLSQVTPPQASLQAPPSQAPSQAPPPQVLPPQATQQGSLAQALPAPAPVSQRPPPKLDLLAQRVSLAVEEAEAAASLASDRVRRAAVANAVTTLLPIVPRPFSRRHRTAWWAAVAIVAVGLATAAVIVLFRARPASVGVASTPPALSLAAHDRSALQRCVTRWSQALLARPPSSGAEAAQQFAALLRAHTAGAPLSPEQQLRLLAVLDRARRPNGWSEGTDDAPTAPGTAWALLAYSHMAQANHATTALDRVRLASDALMALRRPDGTFVSSGGPTSDVVTAMVLWALLEAQRAGLATTPLFATVRNQLSASATARLLAGAVPPSTDALTFWVLWQGRSLGTLTPTEASRLASAFAQTLLARCPATQGCTAAPSWEPWTALALTELLRDPPPTLGAETLRALTSLRALAIGRLGASAERVAEAPITALTPWLFAAAELQRLPSSTR